MTRPIVCQGDLLTILPTFGEATVLGAPPIPLERAGGALAIEEGLDASAGEPGPDSRPEDYRLSPGGAVEARVGPGIVRAARPPLIMGDLQWVRSGYCAYMTPVYGIPGGGFVTVDRVESDHLARRTRSNGQPVLLASGAPLALEFEVVQPAMAPGMAGGWGAPTPDPTGVYRFGIGRFVVTNPNLRGE